MSASSVSCLPSTPHSPSPQHTLVLHLHLHAALRHLAARHLRVQAELHALLGQAALQRRAHLRIVRSRDVVQELHHLHLRAQAAPHRAQLQADHATAHDDQTIRNLAELQRARAVDDALFLVVHGQRRHGAAHYDRRQGAAVREPVAKTMFDASILRSPPASSWVEMMWSDSRVAAPLMYSTWFFLKRNSIPFVRPRT